LGQLLYSDPKPLLHNMSKTITNTNVIKEAWI